MNFPGSTSSRRLQTTLKVSKASISIVIPVYRGGKAFAQCLASLAQFLPSTAEVRTEVVVVVDGQDAESTHLAESFQTALTGLQVLTLPHNCGPAHARNVGAQAARGDLLFFVDADVAIQVDTFYALARVLERSPDLVALIGSYDDTPGSRNFLSQYKNLLHHYTHQIARTEASTFWGACGLIRRDVFLQMGGFDANYRDPCIEDIELGYRLKRAGYSIKLCKDVQVKHLKRWGTRSLLKADFFYRAIPWTELIWRDRTFVSDLNLDASSRLSVVSVYGLILGLLSGLISLTLSSAWMGGPLILFMLLCSLSLLLLNAPVYRFFHQKRGLWFALRTIPWHWLYYTYSGLAFVIGTCRYWLNSDRSSVAQPGLVPYDLLPTQSDP